MGKTSQIALSALGLTALGGREAQVTGLAVDSRDVTPGTLFFALPGSRVHGAAYIGTALRAGAAAILTDAEGAMMARDALDAHDAALVIAENPREALAHSAALWFGAHPDTVVAVTGTNGKTSVSTFCRQIWTELDLAGVNLGTTGIEGAWTHPLRHTTPEPITLHRALARARAEGVTHVAMEASSHGLDQRRLDGIVLAAAGFTNFSQDHLDYHQTLDAYFDAKMGLFTRLLPDDAVAVVNLDDPKGMEVAQIAERKGHEVIGTGTHEAARLRLLGQRYDGTGQELRYSWQGRTFLSRLGLIGGFQASNVLVAAGLAIASGCDAEEVFGTLPQLATVRGRMQLAATRDNGAAIFVDYAHTPDAVQTVLRAMKPHVLGRLIAIVGAGGDRDATKRPLMGEAAAREADLVIVTDDNPRTEDPAVIRQAVMLGCPDATEVPDRAEAILRGVDALQPGDALMILGKGHETGQIVGSDVLPFDDAEQASIAVAALDGRL